MFRATLSADVKIWQQPKYLSIDELKRRCRMYIRKYYSAIKKNKILPSAVTWMDLEGIMLREISQTEKERQMLCDIIYTWNPLVF